MKLFEDQAAYIQAQLDTPGDPDDPRLFYLLAPIHGSSASNSHRLSFCWIFTFLIHGIPMPPCGSFRTVHSGSRTTPGSGTGCCNIYGMRCPPQRKPIDRSGWRYLQEWPNRCFGAASWQTICKKSFSTQRLAGRGFFIHRAVAAKPLVPP